MADRRVSVKVDADVSPFTRGLTTASGSAKAFARELESADGRMAGLVQTGLALAPALVPIGAAAVPAIAGLTTQLGAATAAAGVTVLAFQGVGDALTAVNDYQLEPTAANLEKVNEAMRTLGPAGQEFVMFLQSLRPEMQHLQDVAQEGLSPGMQAGLEDLLDLMPQAESVIGSISSTLGDLFAEAGDNLNDARWVEFFDYLGREAAPTLSAIGKSLGNVVEGLANMIVAFTPLSDDFTSGMLDMSRAFREWTEGLGSSDGFQHFVDYVRDAGPQAMETLGALANALISLVEAAAPVGSAVLPVIEQLADVFSALVESPVGPMIVAAAAAIGTLGRSMAVLKAVGLLNGESMIGKMFAVDKIKAGALALTEVTSAQDRASKSAAELTAIERERTATMRAGAAQFGKNAALIGGLALATSGLADDTGLAHTATYALMGTIAGPWGAAIGGATGLLIDMKDANADVTDELRGLNSAMQSGNVESIRTELSGVYDEMKNAPGIAHGLADAWDQMTGRTDKLADGAARAEEKLKELDDAARGDGLSNLLGTPLDLAREMDVASKSLDEFSSSFERLNGLLGKRQSLVDYERALDDLAATIREGNGFDPHFEKGREGLEKMNRLVETAIGRSEALKKAGDDLGSVRILNRAISDLQNFGKQSPAAKEAAQDLIRQLKNLDKTRAEPKIDADNRPARKKIDEAGDWLDIFGKGKGTATADVNGNPAKSALNQLDHALGAYSNTTGRATADVNTGPAVSGINYVQSLLNNLHDKTITINTVHTTSYAAKRQGIMDAQGYSADGGSVPRDNLPYGDRYPYLLAPGEEVISNRFGQADRHRDLLKAINAGRLADGGTAGGRGAPVGGGKGGGLSGYNLDDRGVILGLLQQIRDLNRDLRRKGKEHLDGLDRRVAETQLEAAKHDLRAAKHREEREKRQKERERERETRRGVRDALSNFSLDSIIPDDRPVTLEGQTRGALRDLKAEILDAGGEWTKGMRRWAKGLIAQASELDDVNKALDAEQQHRDDLVQTLQDQQQALEQLRSTMQQFSDQVAGNFTVGSLPGRTTRTVGGTVDPALSSRLSAAEQRLIAIRSSAGGDSVASAAEASRLMGQIEQMRAEVESQSQPVEQTVDAYHSLREQLISQTADAKQFADALSSLSSMGLNADLFAQIASSGDLATALDLLSGGQAGINDINSLWRQNAEAAAQVAAYATQEVYGPEQQALMAQIDAQNQLIDASTAAIELLNATAKVLGRDVRQGAAAGVAPLGNEIRDLKVTVLGAIRDIPRQQHENKKKAGR